MRTFWMVLALSLVSAVVRVDPVEAQEAPASEAHTVLHVDGMHCATCPITVRVALSHLDGVHSVIVSRDAHRATVAYDPHRVTPERLAQAVTTAGYPARVEH